MRLQTCFLLCFVAVLFGDNFCIIFADTISTEAQLIANSKKLFTSSCLDGNCFFRKDATYEFPKTTNLGFSFELMLNMLLSKAKHQNISESCVADVSQLLKNVIKGTPWAVAMIDAFGKIGSGIQEGNLIWPGSFEQCRKVEKIPSDDKRKSRTFNGQYNWAQYILDFSFKANESENITEVDPRKKMSLKSAVCFPDTCEENDVNDFLKVFLEFGGLLGLPNILNITNVVRIPYERDFWKDSAAVACFVICCIFGGLLTIGTVYEVLFHKKQLKWCNAVSSSSFDLSSNMDFQKSTETITYIDVEKQSRSKEQEVVSSVNTNKETVVVNDTTHANSNNGIFGEILLCFSVYNNGAKILNLERGKETLSPLNGIRFFSMTWVILGHIYVFPATAGFDNLGGILDFIKSFGFQIIAAGTMAVDSFFVLSGLLVTYLFLKEYDRNNGNISWLKFYFHRIWRLTPIYLLILFLFRDNLSKYFGNGPFWPQNGFEGDNCKNNWWWNVLYINNFISSEKMCMSYSWYLANDMQFYILSPLVLIPLAKRFHFLGFGVASLFILTSCISSGYLSHYYKFYASYTDIFMNAGTAADNNQFDIIYDKPYCRIGPYIVGMITGWILYRTKSKIYMSKIAVVIGWALAIACNLSVTTGLYKAQLSDFMNSFYYALSRLAWSVGLSWLIVACCTGYGGIVNQFLSWPAWNPLSRLTYSVYLNHIIIIQVVFCNFDIAGHFSHTNLVFYYISITVVSYVFGLITSLAFESPFVGLEKILLKRK